MEGGNVLIVQMFRGYAPGKLPSRMKSGLRCGIGTAEASPCFRITGRRSFRRGLAKCLPSGRKTDMIASCASAYG